MTAKTQRGWVWRWVVTCLLVLVVAQGLGAVLSGLAFHRQAEAAAQQRAALLAGELGERIENGLQLGKPLAQFFGLDAQLLRLRERQADVQAVAVRLADGQTVVAREGSPGATPPQAQQALRLRDGTVVGTVDLWLDPAAQQAIEADFQAQALWLLLSSTGGAGLLLALWLGAAARRGQASPTLAAPLVALLVAQGVFAMGSVMAFRDAWTAATDTQVQARGASLQADLQRVLDLGVAPQRLHGLEAPFGRVLQALPAVAGVAWEDADGQRRAQVVRPERSLDADPTLQQRWPLRARATDDQPGAVVGHLVIGLDPVVLRQGLRERLLDAGTVAVVSAVVAVELFLLLAVLWGRRAATGGVDAVRLARPVMFAFIAAWALPLSFLPVYAASLPAPDWAGAQTWRAALPLSLEMLLGLMGALWAGRLSDRHGAALPVVAGMVLATLGAVGAAASTEFTGLLLSRAVVGCGYGLAWMGLQGCVVAGSAPQSRGRNMAWLFAGLFAGHLSGAAVGAMVAEQAGARTVLWLGAGVLAVAGLVAWALLRHTARASVPATVATPQPAAGAVTPAASATTSGATLPPATGVAASQPAPGAPRRGWRGLLTLLGNRSYAALLLGYVVPFSVAQVGLMYFALPWSAQAFDLSTAAVGRLIMLYGLCMIYLGPAIGRWVDGRAGRRRYILVGAALGASGLLVLAWQPGPLTMALAVLTMALGSCWAGAALTSWMLALPAVQAHGPGSATSILRAADKLGQMLGPLIMGALFVAMGTGAGLGVIGVGFLVAVLGFVWVTRQTGRAVS